MREGSVESLSLLNEEMERREVLRSPYQKKIVGLLESDSRVLNG